MDAGVVELALVQRNAVVRVRDGVLEPAELQSLELVPGHRFLRVEDGVIGHGDGLSGDGGLRGVEGHDLLPTSWGWYGCVRGTLQ